MQVRSVLKDKPIIVLIYLKSLKLLIYMRLSLRLIRYQGEV